MKTTPNTDSTGQHIIQRGPTHGGLPLWREYPKWCCPYCGEPVGYLGNLLSKLFGSFHGCDFSNVRPPQA